MQNNLQPKVSIVVPCYNHQPYIRSCIESIISQDYENIELIIIDDGSKDESVKEIEALVNVCQNRFSRFEFRSRGNKGLSATLNEALEWCQGDYFSSIASDDMLLPKKTSIQIDFFNSNPDVIAVFGGVKVIDDNNNIIDIIEGTDKAYNFDDVILQNAVILAPTQMIRLSGIRKVGGFDPDIPIEDWYMWLKLAQLGKLYCLEDYLSLYRYHGDNISKKVDIMHQARLDVLREFKEHNLYKEAISKVSWLNHYEQIIHIGDNKLYHYQKMLTLMPYETTKLSFKKAIKLVKKKLNLD